MLSDQQAEAVTSHTHVIQQGRLCSDVCAVSCSTGGNAFACRRRKPGHDLDHVDGAELNAVLLRLIEDLVQLRVSPPHAPRRRIIEITLSRLFLPRHSVFNLGRKLLRHLVLACLDVVIRCVSSDVTVAWGAVPAESCRLLELPTGFCPDRFTCVV
ncbi:hypothetical protein OG946_18810 [Streptomyces sp. NBC_01808]|uniref:hypothetical protein n=1 Tax=Streptomyces sp. NBC_01808 TaxID=2975947 RepID=UPI002DD8F67D|nr:hypothetical protein [Streptomyces sp. NBC_01808]WSA39232.1 hypothetical protein OG946_18810 [Streptomyces sp. NBC_01808]